MNFSVPKFSKKMTAFTFTLVAASLQKQLGFSETVLICMLSMAGGYIVVQGVVDCFKVIYAKV